MDEDQQRALDLAQRGSSFFLTGAGGTGKSYVIRDIVNSLRKNGRIVALTAMTGCAALLLGEDAKTLHSWAGIGLGAEEVPLILAKIRKFQKARKNWLATETLIIDEVSMMTPDLLDKLDLIAKAMKRCPDPFGGIQIILVGDLYQLPPVSREGSFFVFESASWPLIIKETISLTKVHRQSDPIFLKILGEAREGFLTEESIRILETRKTSSWKKLEIKPTLLFTRRADVDEINQSQLKKCEGEDVIFRARTRKTQQHFTENTYKDHVKNIEDKLDKSGAYVPELRLRKGAQVMYLINGIHADKDAKEEALQELYSRVKPDHMTNEEWWTEKKNIKINIMRDYEEETVENIVNGSRGVIEGFTEWTNFPRVKFMNGDVHTIRHHTWPAEDGIQRQQIPLRLAYAVTIHKAQGATLDCALIDIGKNTFEYGQAYVALSRVKSLESLYIWELDPAAFRVNPKVRAFLGSQLPKNT